MLTYKDLPEMPVRAKKSLGQHFLIDGNYCRKIIRYAQINSVDTVIEIGPGRGDLTDPLLATAAEVIAVEFDSALVAHLKVRFGDHPRLHLLEADILGLDWGDIVGGRPVKLVGNLPYNLSTQILLRTTEIKDRFHSFTFMVQKEVAERILARPETKNYGYFTVLMEYHFTRVRGFNVPPGVFTPQPRVLSHVMKLLPRDPPYPAADYLHFVALLKKAFRHRRKTLWNNLKPGSPERETIAAAFHACQIHPRARPEQVTLAQYFCLARML